MTRSKALTYWPKKKKRKRKHGFLKRSQSRYGKRVLSRRRRKGRKRLAV
ncbi:MAG: 50S ribosomal protein L34 [Patescibacteria group bacterium]